MAGVRPILIAVLAALFVCGCTTPVRRDIEGNNTGGIIPAELVTGGNAQALASAHCAKWNSVARITFGDAGSDVVFVCERPAAPPQAPVPPAKPAPAKPRR